MFIKRIASSYLSASRLDTSFYNPEAIAIIEKIKSGIFETFGSSGTVWGFGAYELCNQIQESVEKDSPGFIKIGDLESPFINVDDVSSVTPETHKLLAAAHVRPGDLLVSIAGTIGSTAIIPETNRKLSGNQAILKYRASPDKFDSYYVAAYTLSDMFKLITAKEAGGAVQKNLYLHNFLTIPIAKPQMAVQTYIGNKVRQAELLREWANNIDVKIQGYHQAFIPSQINLDFEKKTRLVSTHQMTERMDAHFYPGVVDTYLNQNLGYFEKLSSCCTSIFNGQSQPKIGLDGCEQITVANLSPNYINGQLRYVEKPSNKDKFTEKCDLLMCNAAHQKSYIGKDITFVHTDKALLPSTEVMVIRADTSKVPASYLRTYFLSKLGFVQIQSTIRGITAHSYPVDMAKLDIFIPSLEGKELTDWLGTDDFLVKAGIASEFSTQLTTSAKLIVEALIKGTVTEAELIAAQQALESDDNTKDRAILSKLSDKGYAVKEGKPLFSELDALYELLDEAQQDKVKINANE